MDKNEYLAKYNDFVHGSSIRRENYIADDNFIYDGMKFLTSEEFSRIIIALEKLRPELLENVDFIETLKEETLNKEYPIIRVAQLRSQLKK